MLPLAPASPGFDHEAPPGFSQRRPDGRRTIGRHALVKMRDAIGTVAVTEHQSMTERHLPAYGIGGQIDPRTFADFPVRIVSNLGTETADRNDSIHGVLPRALGPILDACPAGQPVTDRTAVTRLTRPLSSSDHSLVPCTNAIPHDPPVDELATGATHEDCPAPCRSPHRGNPQDPYSPGHEAPYIVAALSSDWSTSPTCENSTGLTTNRRAPWRNTTCVRCSLSSSAMVITGTRGQTVWIIRSPSAMSNCAAGSEQLSPTKIARGRTPLSSSIAASTVLTNTGW